MKNYFTRLLLRRRYEKFTQPVAKRRSLTISAAKTDINNKFYDIISLSFLSEPCTFFVIFPSSRAAENIFAEEVTTKDVRRNTEFMWEGKPKRKISEKRNRKEMKHVRSFVEVITTKKMDRNITWEFKLKWNIFLNFHG